MDGSELNGPYFVHLSNLGHMNPPIARWLQAPAGTTLFRVTKDPLEPSEFEEIVNSDGDVISRWGRSSTIEVRHAYF